MFCLHISGACSAHGDKESIGVLELELGCHEPPCRRWESNLGHLQEQRVPLTTDPSLQLPEIVFN